MAFIILAQIFVVGCSSKDAALSTCTPLSVSGQLVLEKPCQVESDGAAPRPAPIATETFAAKFSATGMLCPTANA